MRSAVSLSPLTRLAAVMQYPHSASVDANGFHAAQVLCGLGHDASSPSGQSTCGSVPESPAADEEFVFSSSSQRSSDEATRASRRELLASRRDQVVLTVEQKHARWQNELATALEQCRCRISRLLLGPATHLNALDTALFMSRLLPREIALLAPTIRKVSCSCPRPR